MSTTLDTLLEMGFTKQRAELALSKTGTKDVQAAMEWLLNHQEDDPEEIPTTQETEPVVTSQPPPDTPAEELSSSSSANAEDPAQAKSIRCDDCGKLFRTSEEVEFHASKSGHANFSESTEEKKPLTEEEKREQLAKIEAKLKARRLQREAKEKEEALLREKNRIKSGKELYEVKKKHEEMEMKKIVEQKKREKEEERQAKQRVRDQIEQDKLARKSKFGGGVAAVETSPPQVSVVPKPVVAKPSTNYTEVKLQIKLTNGVTLTHTFGAKEPLSAVRLYVEMHRTDTEGPFSLMPTFPKRVFTNDDFEKPLETLGLAPASILTVAKC